MQLLKTVGIIGEIEGQFSTPALNLFVPCRVRKSVEPSNCSQWTAELRKLLLILIVMIYWAHLCYYHWLNDLCKVAKFFTWWILQHFRPCMLPFTFTYRHTSKSLYILYVLSITVLFLEAQVKDYFNFHPQEIPSLWSKKMKRPAIPWPADKGHEKVGSGSYRVHNPNQLVGKRKIRKPIKRK